MDAVLAQVIGPGLSVIALIIIVIFVIALVFSAIKIVKEYERGVIFRLGRVRGGRRGPASLSCCRSWTA